MSKPSGTNYPKTFRKGFPLYVLFPMSNPLFGWLQRRCSPLPIPNREVKPALADDTALVCGKVSRRPFFIRESINGSLFSCIYIMNKRDLVASLAFCVFADGSTLVPVAARRGRRAAVVCGGTAALLGCLLLGGGQVGPRQVVGHQRVLALALAARGGRLHLGAELHLHVRDLLRRAVFLLLHARLGALHRQVVPKAASTLL